MRNVSEKNRREYQNTHFVFINFFFVSNCAIYEIIWKYIVECDRPQMRVGYMCIVCCTPEARNINFYITFSVLNMFWTLIHPSSGACYFSIVSPHWFVCSCCDVCWSFVVAGLGLYPCDRLKLCFSLPHRYHPNQRHRNTHRNKNTETMW